MIYKSDCSLSFYKLYIDDYAMIMPLEFLEVFMTKRQNMYSELP